MLSDAFAQARREGRLAFVPYLMVGDPDLATTEAIVAALSAAGVDAIELGVPYGDPIGDGPTIASAGARALAGGTRLRDVLALVRRCRGASPPLVIFTYFNPVYQFGIERFAKAAAAAGAAAVIVADLALEEGRELRAALQACHVAMPLLVAPSTPRERAERIAAAATGFVYVVSRLGVTGANHAPNGVSLRRRLATLRELTDKPLAVGFGVRRDEDVRNVAGLADAVVVGSALIDAVHGRGGEEGVQRVRDFLAPLMAATRQVLL
jgi:tryptophan synthase alpha chain